MNLYLCGSKRKKNCFKILNDIKEERGEMICLGDKDIKFCLGCNSCEKKLENFCVINDDMKQVYEKILEADNLIIASPIYFNQVTGILKNMIDRLNPFCNHEALEGKKVFLITVGTMSEEENGEVSNHIQDYFNELAEIFKFELTYLKNFTSNIEDDVEKSYTNYASIVNDLKGVIK